MRPHLSELEAPEEEPFDEDWTEEDYAEFYKSYKVFDLQKNEIIVNIAFDVPDKSYHFNFEKVSKRTHLDIESVNSAI